MRKRRRSKTENSRERTADINFLNWINDITTLNFNLDDAVRHDTNGYYGFKAGFRIADSRRQLAVNRLIAIANLVDKDSHIGRLATEGVNEQRQS